jgi:hypothetical protein
VAERRQCGGFRPFKRTELSAYILPTGDIDNRFLTRQLRGLFKACRPNIERIVRWTLRDDEMDQGLREVEEGLAEMIAEIEGAV